MNNLARRIAHAAVAVILGLSSVCMSPRIAFGDEHPARVDIDGAQHIDTLTIPPSDLWSPEFKKAYAKAQSPEAAAEFQKKFPDFHMPARNAPKAEWDKYYADSEEMLSGDLAWDLDHFPVNIMDTKIAGVHVGIISPKNGIAPENQHRILIDLHGGGFVDNRGLVFGELESIQLASIARIKIITLDYRQAPFYKYPAASEDVEAVYKELLKQYKAEAIGIYGTSAGGWLTAQAVARFQAKGLPRPGAVGIFCASPPTAPLRWGWGDAGLWDWNGLLVDNQDPVPVGGADTWYMGEADVNDPQAYPGSSDSALAKFPPTLFLTGTRETLMSKAIVSHARMLKLGVDSYLYMMEGGWHGDYVYGPVIGTPEVHDIYVYIARWFNQHLAR